MRLFGYARVSTSQQSLDIQVSAFKDAGVKVAFIIESKCYLDCTDISQSISATRRSKDANADRIRRGSGIAT